MATNSIIESSTRKPKSKYQTLHEVPNGLVSREQWRQKGRQVKSGAQHRAILEIIEQDQVTGSLEYTSDKLYAVEDTIPTRKPKIDPWLDAYWDVFVKDHNQYGYIRWSDRDKEWKTITPAAPPTKWTAPYLRKGDVQAHVAEREIRGVFGGECTQWIAIDVDCHKPTADLQALFLDQLAVLVRAFSQRAVQVADEDAKGTHVFLFYPRGSLEHYRHQVRQYLLYLDQQQPELAERARELDPRHEDGTRKLVVKTLGELEIFPDPDNGFRLPLARGRTMLLDKPLDRRPNRQKRLVHDLAGFMAWVQDPYRRYMEADAIVAYVRQRLMTAAPVTAAKTISPAAPTNTTSTRTTTATSSTPNKLQGCYRQTLISYWRSERVTPNSLDAMLLASARILPFEVDEDEAHAVLLDLVNGLTDLSVSSRLLNGDWKAIDRAVKRAVKTGYHTDPSVESETLVAVAAAFKMRGFKLSDRTTWSQPDFKWTPEELEVIEREFVPMFPRAENGVVSAALAHFIKYMKGKTGQEVARDMWHLPFSRFKGMTLGKHAKKTAFKQKLLDLGWLVIVTHPYKPCDGSKGRATGYAIGPALKDKFPRITAPEAGMEEVPKWLADMRLETALSL